MYISIYISIDVSQNEWMAVGSLVGISMAWIHFVVHFIICEISPWNCFYRKTGLIYLFIFFFHSLFIYKLLLHHKQIHYPTVSYVPILFVFGFFFFSFVSFVSFDCCRMPRVFIVFCWIRKLNAYVRINDDKWHTQKSKSLLFTLLQHSIWHFNGEWNIIIYKSNTRIRYIVSNVCREKKKNLLSPRKSNKSSS